MQKKRFTEIDLLRGIAVMGMVVFHVFFLLDYFDVLKNEMYEGGWLVLARFVQISFLGLVGISLAISTQSNRKEGNGDGKWYKRRYERGAMILAVAALVSLSTWLVIPKEYVRFGILHLIGISVFLLSPVARYKMFPFLIGALMISGSSWIARTDAPFHWLLILGFNVKNFQTVDYFPIFPWMGVVAWGITVGNVCYENARRKFPILKISETALTKIPVKIGKHSLTIYWIHIPIIYGIISLWRIIT